MLEVNRPDRAARRRRGKTDWRLTAVLTRYAPVLLARPGLDPDTTAALLITPGDNPDQLASEGSFAAVAGAASPGKPGGSRSSW